MNKLLILIWGCILFTALSTLVAAPPGGVNEAPVADDQNVTTAEDTPVKITLSASDDDDDSLTYVIADNPSHGDIEPKGTDNVVTYTPDPGYNGDDSFTFKANDGTDDSNIATVSITVSPVNDAPVASDQNVTTNENTSIEITLVASDDDGDSLTYVIADNPSHGDIDKNENVVTYTPDDDFTGSDSLTFKANDGTVDSNTATVSITVSEVNHAPITSDKIVTTDEEKPVDITLEANDIDGDQLTYSIDTGPSHGSVTLTGNTSTYTPDPNYNGDDSFTFKANDGTDDSNIATVSITVSAVNDAPVAYSRSLTTPEDTQVKITLVAIDVDGDPLTYIIVDNPLHGDVDKNENVVTYTPDDDYTGSDSFTFKVNDGTVDSEAATVSITVTSVNDAPVADDQSVSTYEDTSVEITLTATDSDSVSFIYSIVDDPSYGTVNLVDDIATYTPDDDFTGSDSFTFKANDGTDDSNIATVSITVSPVNVAPVAYSRSMTTPEDTQVKITLSASDDDGDSLTYSIVESPIHGTFAQTGNVVTYTPNANYYGYDSFKFKVNDGTVDSNIATVSITVSAVNDVPVAYGQSVTTYEDTPVKITLVANDVDGDSLTYIVSSPVHGTIAQTGNVVTYTPATEYYSSDIFTFRANDGTVNSNIATVSITINSINDAPVASDQSVTTYEDTPVKITLVASDDDGDSLTYSIVASPVHGTIAQAGNVVTYTPTADYTGSDGFSFNANDGALNSNTATVSITVNQVNDAPVAYGQSITTPEDTPVKITLAANDDDGDSLTYSIVASPVHGTVAQSDNVVTYTPTTDYTGSDIFTFKVNDGTVDSNTATVSVTVGAVNDAPVADDQSITTAEDTPVKITLDANDDDGDQLKYIIVEYPLHGTIAQTGNVITYTPTADYTGPDRINFKANDGAEDSNIAKISINVNPVNDAPVAYDQSITTPEDTPVKITLVANDLDGDSLTYSIVDVPYNGTIVLTDNTATYNPYLNYNGANSFTFKANDGTVDSNIATVSITVDPVNDAPVAYDQSITTAKETPVNITFVCTDDECDPLKYSIVASPIHGTINLTDNMATYTPTAEYTGSDRFTFKANDSTADSNIATVSISVVADATPPEVYFLTPENDMTVKYFENIVMGEVVADDLGYAALKVLNGNNIMIRTYLLSISDSKFARRVEFAPNQINTLQLIASDRAGNFNSTNIRIFVQDNCFQEECDVNDNEAVTIDATDLVDTWIDLYPSTSASNVRFAITAITNDTLVAELDDSAYAAYGEMAVGKIVEIEVDGLDATDESEVQHVLVKLYYTKYDLDLDGDGIIEVGEPDEDNLFIYWYDTTNSRWTKLLKEKPDWVIDNGQTKISGDEPGCVWVDVKHLSTFALTALPIPEPPDDSYQESTSGGVSGSSGGGSTGEPFENIAVKEVLREYITIGKANYEFKEEANSIEFIRFDANLNLGYITATIEVLKDTSALVSTPPSGEVYQNVNIWIRKADYTPEHKTTNRLIGFKVARSWVDENGIDVSTIKLNRYSSNSWSPLKTMKIGENRNDIYFVAETPGFSPFAITGEKISSAAFVPSSTPASTTPVSENKDAVSPTLHAPVTNNDARVLPVEENALDIPAKETKSSSSLIVLVGLIGLIAIGIGLRKDDVIRLLKERL